VVTEVGPMQELMYVGSCKSVQRLLDFGLSMYLDHTFARKTFAQRNHFNF